MSRSLYVYAKDSEINPYMAKRMTCNKCRRVECFSLHDYVSTACPFQTCDICTSLAQVDDEISKAQDLLFELAKKRQEIREKINCRHDQLINRLPTEIVSLIFAFSADTNFIGYVRSHQRHTWSPVLLLGAVSKTWRAITLGIPQLWTTVTIDPCKDSTRLDVTGDWLYRSRALPLSITFKCRNHVHSEDDEILNMELALRLFRSHSSRWKCVTFQVPSYILHGLLDGLEDIPQVDSLRIDLRDRLVTHKGPMRMLHSLRPKTLYTRNYSLSDISLQWDNLTQLEVSLFDVDELVHIIRHGTKLVRCIADAVRESGGNYPLPSTPIVNYTITDMVTKASPPETNFLRYITLPSLTHLDYTFESHEQSLDILVTFIQRSKPPLGRFFFHHRMADDHTTEPWYDRLPEITDVKLDITRMDPGNTDDTINHILSALAHDRDSIALPNLQTFELTTSYIWDNLWAMFANIFSVESKDSHDETPPSIVNSAAAASLPSTGRGRRPWRMARVVINRVLADDCLMDEETLGHLLNIRNSGMELNLLDNRREDLLQLAGSLYERLRVFDSEMQDPETHGAFEESDG